MPPQHMYPTNSAIGANNISRVSNSMGLDYSPLRSSPLKASPAPIPSREQQIDTKYQQMRDSCERIAGALGLN